MKRQSLIVCLALATIATSASGAPCNNNISTGGLPEGDFFVGDAIVAKQSPIQVAAVPSAQSVADVATKSIQDAVNYSINQTPESTNPAIAAAEKVRTLAGAALIAVPGAAFSRTHFSPLILANAELKGGGTNLKLNGSLLQNNILMSLAMNPVVSEYASASSQTSHEIVTASDRWVPIVFFSISANMLSTKAGAPFSIKWKEEATYNLSAIAGLAATADVWTIERVDLTKPVTGAFIPYRRVGDYAVPIILADGGANKVKLAFSNVDTSDTVNVEFPGIDSSVLHDFMKAYGYAFGQ